MKQVNYLYEIMEENEDTLQNFINNAKIFIKNSNGKHISVYLPKKMDNKFFVSILNVENYYFRSLLSEYKAKRISNTFFRKLNFNKPILTEKDVEFNEDEEVRFM